MTMEARYGGTCPLCERPYRIGQDIARVPGGRQWGHPECAEAAANTQAILDGKTFRGHKPSDWRLGRGPGSSRKQR
ncbi:hypothetical protein Drose_05840 [Dactylosporangium roseum]|uniref:Uncharacterized protein n=1 Tax=Dactylosporangium roseum TaxID=47989 RepID=A0ABY5Z8K1_9ACTN|nr:hypothetical protein [Dactylosporangium roseum]UWZ37792.1 hypothetical protein Drose_05840 [Dactylosporangium roseum]